MKNLHLILLSASLLLFTGCADIETPKVGQIISNPIGTTAVKVGMTKSQVKTLYRDPDMKRDVRSDEWGDVREEWFYRARLDAMPINADYLAKDIYLYFDGESLTNISASPLGTPVKSATGPENTFIK